LRTPHSPPLALALRSRRPHSLALFGWHGVPVPPHIFTLPRTLLAQVRPLQARHFHLALAVLPPQMHPGLIAVVRRRAVRVAAPAAAVAGRATQRGRHNLPPAAAAITQHVLGRPCGPVYSMLPVADLNVGMGVGMSERGVNAVEAVMLRWRLNLWRRVSMRIRLWPWRRLHSHV
jgi:hypothetical protein